MFRNFLYLLLVFCAAFLVGGLAWIYYELNPSPSVDGWNLFGDGVTILFFFCLVFLIGIVWWTVKVIRDIRRNYSNKRYVLSNGLLLLVAYSPLIGYITIVITSQVHRAFQRNQSTTVVDSYEIIKLSEKHYFRNVQIKADSCFVFTTNQASSVNDPSDKPFRFSDSKFHFADGKMSELEIYTLSDKNLVRSIHYKPQINAFGNMNIIHVHDSLPCIWHRSNDGHYIEWTNQCRGSYRHVLHGFEEKDRSGGGSKPLYFIDSELNEWSLFYTESKATNFSKMFVAKIGEHTEQAYKIEIRKEDQEWFDHERVIGIYAAQGYVYIVGLKGILVFDV